MVVITLTKWVLLFVGWVIAMPMSLQIVTNNISLLGYYHKANLNNGLWEFFHFERNGDENFLEKCLLVLKANFFLSLFLLSTYYIVISDALKESFGMYQISCFSVELTLVSLITIRLLSNQSNYLTVNVRNLPPNKELYEYVRERNEKTIAHFHTFICTALILLGIFISASVMEDQDLSSIHLPNFNVGSYYCLLCAYLSLLIIFTFVVEFILLISPPIITISSKSSKLQTVIETKIEDSKKDKINEDETIVNDTMETKSITPQNETKSIPEKELNV
jgi:hypothetical protein